MPSLADMTRLSEHVMRVFDVLCLSAVTIRGLVRDFLDVEGLDARLELQEARQVSTEGHDVRPGEWWVRQLLHGMLFELQEACQVRDRAPQPCSAARQHAPAVHQAVLADEHARCQRRPRRGHRRDLLPVHQIGWGRRDPKVATTLTVAFSMDRGPLEMLVQIVHAGKTDAVLPEKLWLERTHHVTSENGRATTTLLQLAASLDDVMNPVKEGQSWILLWDMASSHASEATMIAMKAKVPHVVLCFIRFKSCIQTQATATLGRSVLDGSFDDIVMNAWRRQSSAEW